MLAAERIDMKLAQTSEFPAPHGVPAGAAGYAGTQDRLIQDLQCENARLRRAVAELEGYRNLAYRDAMTGLWNRRYFEDRLSEELSLCRRNSNRRLSLMVVDVNDLKLINDRDGHAAGDQAIKRTASFLKSRLREEDVCCRVGGDEFAIILRELGPIECGQLMARLRAELRASNGRRAVALSVSLGTASYPEQAANGHELYLRADEAMYQDKRERKGALAPLQAG
jgi:diguanylate cyclase (GGDEF)-like protein